MNSRRLGAATLFSRVVVIALIFALAAALVIVTAPDRASGSVAPGGKIAFSNDGSRVFVTNPDGTGQIALSAANATSDSRPAFNSDGTRIAFTSCRADGLPSELEPVRCSLGNDVDPTLGDANIFVMDSAGGNQILRTSNLSDDLDPDFSPDGSQLAFVSYRDGNADIFRMDTSGAALESGLVQMTDDLLPAVTDLDPAWSPVRANNQSRIAWSRGGNLWSMPSNGTLASAVQLTTGGNDSSPSWSPDGSRIAFIRAAGGTSDIWSLDVDALGNPGALTRLTNDASTEEHPSWSPDGGFIAFASNRTGSDGFDIWRITAAGTDPVKIVSRPGNDRQPDWVENLTLISSASSSSASPESIPVAQIPINSSAPGIQTAPSTIEEIGLAPSTIEEIGLSASTLEEIGLTPSTIEEIGLSASTLEEIGLTPSTIEEIGLAAPDVLKGLESVPLSSVILRPTPGLEQLSWEWVLEGTGLGPAHNLSLADVFQVRPIPPRLSLIKVANFDLTTPPMNSLSVIALMMGKTQLGAMRSQSFWCPLLQGLGYSTCGKSVGGLKASLLNLHFASVRFDDPNFPIPVHAIGVSQTVFDPGAPILKAKVAKFNLATAIGGIKVTALDPTVVCLVVNCALVDESDPALNLYGASQIAGGILPDATLSMLLKNNAAGSLRLGDLIFGLFRSYPIESLPESKIKSLIRGWNGAGSKSFQYIARYVPVGEASMTAKSFKMRLPSEFIFDSASVAVVKPDGSRTAVGNVEATSSKSAAGLDVTITFDTQVLAGQTVEAVAKVLPGLELGTFSTSSFGFNGSSPSLGEINENRTKVLGVTVGDTFETNNTPGSAKVIQPNQLIVGFTPSGDTADYYLIETGPDDTQFSLTLFGNDIDRDVTVWYPNGAKATLPLNGNGPTQTPVDVLDDPELAFDNSRRSLQPNSMYVSNLAGRVLAAVGQQRGTTNEELSFRSSTSNGSGAGEFFLVRVSVFNNTFSTKAPEPYFMRFTKTAPATLPACTPTSFSFDPDPFGGIEPVVPWPPAITVDTKTVFLINKNLMEALHGETKANAAILALTELASHAKVKGSLVFVDGNTDVKNALQAWINEPCRPSTANDAGRQIISAVNGVAAAAGASLENVVLVGDSRVMPRLAISDATSWGSEDTFGRPVVASIGNNVETSIAAKNYIWTDDPYASGTAVLTGAGWVYPPDHNKAVGRLPSVDDIPAAAARFQAADGFLDISTAQVFGTDFLKDSAAEISQELKTEILNVGGSIDDTFTTGALRTGGAPASGSKSPDLISANVHSSDRVHEAPGSPLDPFLATEVANAGGKLEKVSVTMGCHTGYSVNGRLSWTQAKSNKGVDIQVSQITYGLGSKTRVDLTEKLMSSFVKNMFSVDADGLPMRSGKALSLAKNALFDEDAAPSVYTIKAMEGATFVGLPMLRVRSASGAPPSLPQPSYALETQPNGIKTGSLTSTPTFTKKLGSRGFYWEADGLAKETLYRPTLPLKLWDVSRAGDVARGALVTVKKYTDHYGIDPDDTRPLLAGSAIDPSFNEFTDVAFPDAPCQVSKSFKKVLSCLLGDFTQTGTATDGGAVGRYRVFDDVLIQVTHANGANPASLADTLAPEFVSSGVTTSGPGPDGLHTATFNSTVTDNNGNNNVRVYVLYLDESGAGKLLELTRIGTSSNYSGTTKFQGPGLEALFQAVDGGGWVKYDKFKSLWYSFPKPKIGITPKKEYKFDGFFSPFLGREAQAGSAIPMKFTISDNGIRVTRLSAVLEVYSFQVDCTTKQRAPNALIRNEPIGNLKYDVVAAQFNYKWETDVSWGPGHLCYRFNVDLDDGTTRSAVQKFKP